MNAGLGDWTDPGEKPLNYRGKGTFEAELTDGSIRSLARREPQPCRIEVDGIETAWIHRCLLPSLGGA